jgi:hypothetical protein
VSPHGRPRVPFGARLSPCPVDYSRPDRVPEKRPPSARAATNVGHVGDKAAGGCEYVPMRMGAPKDARGRKFGASPPRKTNQFPAGPSA